MTDKKTKEILESLEFRKNNFKKLSKRRPAYKIEMEKNKKKIAKKKNIRKYNMGGRKEIAKKKHDENKILWNKKYKKQFNQIQTPEQTKKMKVKLVVDMIADGFEFTEIAVLWGYKKTHQSNLSYLWSLKDKIL